MSNVEKDEGVIYMKAGDSPIEMNSASPVSYYATSNYDKNLLNATYTWHQIIIHHRGKYKKKDILNALFDLVGEYEFYPVAYTKHDLSDKFLIRQCRNAMQKLFETNLTLSLPNYPNQTIRLTVKLNVADYKYGQIYPSLRLEKAIERQLAALENIEDVSNVLNLDRLSAHPELADIVINLGNKAALDLLFKVLTMNHDILNSINGLKLSNNNITLLSPFSALANTNLQMIDLRLNNVKFAAQFKYLKCINMNELYLAGNPVTNTRGFIKQIMDTLPNLIKLDGIHTKVSAKDDSGKKTLEVMFEGELICSRDTVNFKKFKTSDMWHQVTVDHKGRYTKAEIVDSLMAMFLNQPHDFYPCYYKVETNCDAFFVRNAYDALEYLLSSGLALKAPGSEDTIPIRIKMNVAKFEAGQVEPAELIAAAAAERFNLMDRVLNLENFCSCEVLKNMTISLSNPNILSNLLMHCARRYVVNVMNLKLGYNDIVSGKGMHPIVYMKYLKVVDLSNNKIENIADLDTIPKGSLKELRLDGNPLCRKFVLSSEYIAEVKKIFPSLQKLDEVILTNDQGGISMQKNYLCSMEAYDFTEQFITNYFKAYDSNQRQQLVDMYHRGAIFSLSVNYDQGKTNSFHGQRINKYVALSRNLLKFSNYNRAMSSLIIGRDDIAMAFKTIPKSEHDFYSFTVDTTVFTRQLVIITVTGVFQEPGSSLLENDLQFAFSRTFVLHPNACELGFFKNTTEYKIVNEQLLITNPSHFQLRNAFKYAKPESNFNIVATTADEKEGFIIMFQQMTGLKNLWCTRCFEEGKWNFKKAIEHFLDLLNKHQIPVQAFMEGKYIT